MIRVRTIGAYEVAKMNPVLTAGKDIVNNTLYADKDGTLYLIANEITGDDAYREGVTIAKGNYLNAYRVDAWIGLDIIADAKHVSGGIDSFNYDGNDVLVYDESSGGLKSGDKTGLHFVAVGKCILTEKAVILRVVGPEAGE